MIDALIEIINNATGASKGTQAAAFYDKHQKVIYIPACSYYEEINYTYGEDWDCRGPNPFLEKIINCCPQVKVYECYDCYGCGDW